MKVKFFLSDNDLAPTTISGKLLADAMASKDYDVEVVQDIKRKQEILINGDADTIIFQKKYDIGHRAADFKHLKHKIFLVHIDDDYGGMDTPANLDTLQTTDLIMVGTNDHAEKLRCYVSTPVEVFSAISDFDHYPYIPIEQKDNSPLIISWQQSLADQYIDDLKVLAKPICNLHNIYGIRLQLYGWHEGRHYGVKDKRPEVLKLFPFAECISFEPHSAYLDKTVPQISKTDIFVLPYISSNDRLGKSGFGLKQMMMLGLPCVVSDTRHHRHLIEDGVTGFLCADENSWFERIKQLVESYKLRKYISVQVRRMVERRFSYENTVSIFLAALRKHGLDEKRVN